MEIPAEHVIAALQRRIGEDAVTIAAQAAHIELQDIELTRLRSERVEVGQPE